MAASLTCRPVRGDQTSPPGCVLSADHLLELTSDDLATLLSLTLRRGAQSQQRSMCHLEAKQACFSKRLPSRYNATVTYGRADGVRHVSLESRRFYEAGPGQNAPDVHSRGR